jgi:hypothetical protein
MWDGALDGPVDNKTSKDLTNIKLAKNQLVRPYILTKLEGAGTNEQVLHQQIESIRRTVERQNEMMTTLMKSLNVKGVEDPAPLMDRRSVDEDGKQLMGSS